ncbi:cytochrome P450 [Rickenella mellea]|uniref:Cytochrome P450 n=1 Tax=Rickenella mellea TaxID=50990 RepID=A0A4Y7Q9W8_9AGAM|nr:cytochrome P450 [Rickenella mellea]
MPNIHEAAVGTILALLFWIYLRYKPLRRAPEPPGPAGIPIFGNEFQIPQDKQWLRFHEWSKVYGDVVRLTTMGQPVIILSSAQAAVDLLDARGTVYSDRPRAVMAGELVGWDRGLGYSPYNSRFKEFRRMFQHTLGPRPVQSLIPLQERENARFLLRVLIYPNDFIEHARQSTGAAILMISYGYAIQPNDDPFVKIAEEAMKGFSKSSEPGAFMVDRFPFFQYVPEWFPGAGFKRAAREMREDLERLYDVPYEFVRKQMASGNASPSFTSKYLNEKRDTAAFDDDFVKAAAASLYSGGADTTPSAVTTFILAMVHNRHVQSLGQAEVDNVIGHERLPTIADKGDLVYVGAIVREVLRWGVTVPLGLPHQVSQDDVYRGYSIRKGTIIWANIWSILHDENYFPKPNEFRPERYLKTDDYDPSEILRHCDPLAIAFGFGRRICPGMHLAENSLFLTVATILATFDIAKATDADGNEITPEVEFSGFISHPRPFRCKITPRSETAAELVRSYVVADQSIG